MFGQIRLDTSSKDAQCSGLFIVFLVGIGRHQILVKILQRHGNTYVFFFVEDLQVFVEVLVLTNLKMWIAWFFKRSTLPRRWWPQLRRVSRRETSNQSMVWTNDLTKTEASWSLLRPVCPRLRDFGIYLSDSTRSRLCDWKRFMNWAPNRGGTAVIFGATPSNSLGFSNLELVWDALRALPRSL